ncbi:Uncharacterized protein APZ42_027800 [Daphnia magna]|uniref:Uncharacterized protein n=1 Tax=Daphnia magna TaxID=35525 RepID=A0A164R259_9CRUS|nr:Uncharacterized protein APZ42_027800 [Daphnia magna]
MYLKEKKKEYTPSYPEYEITHRFFLVPSFHTLMMMMMVSSLEIFLAHLSDI